MGRPNKLQRFEEVHAFPNVFEPPVDTRSLWKEIFKSRNPITVELGCGRGEYSIGLAERYPKHNFVGVDTQGERIWYGAKYALEHGVTNVRFLRIQIHFLLDFFATNEVSELWLTFPDPFLRDRSSNRRLTAEPFLDKYQEILQPNGLLHLKTDNEQLFRFSEESITAFGGTLLASFDDIDAAGVHERYPNLDIQTNFEQKNRAKGKTIHYLQAKLPR